MRALLVGFVVLSLSTPIVAEEAAAESTKVEDVKAIIATAAKADKVILYEGLPHPLFEKKQLKVEKEKKTIEIAGWPFYAEPLELKEGDGKKILDFVGNEKMYVQFRGEKKCGGFHPDYAIEWRVGKDKYHLLVCFGCSEFKVYGQGKAVRTDQGGELNKIIQSYRKNRPKPKDE
jgi:hypothetical protein